MRNFAVPERATVAHSESLSQRLEPGRPWPLGATVEAQGVNFALFSAHAEAVELCLFDPSGKQELKRLEMPEWIDGVWCGFAPGLKEGQVYGYRVHGPYAPHEGHRFNPAKLLLDPYAKRLQGTLIWNDALYGYERGHPDGSESFDTRDSAPYVPKAVVCAPQPPADRHSLKLPRPDEVVLEAHLGGLSQQHPKVLESLRGCYAGAASEPLCDYYKRLGISAIEFLPLHSMASEDFLVERGLSNYWGYQTLNFFCPDARFARNDANAECLAMIQTLHQQGLAVLLDVVYNHSAEGNHNGPTLSYRGIDNRSYYRLLPEAARYVNDTGTGNTFNFSHPRVVQLALDSLRHWSSVYGIDGFRFDLAATLGREGVGHESYFDAGAGFFDALLQDPLLQDRWMIAEPWDIGPGGYQLGGFPARFSEWNDQFRDVIRRFWAGDYGQLPNLADRLLGSHTLFSAPGRVPHHSINFITAHDGFTLADLVSHVDKHNIANGEDNHDGHNHNFSFNHGVEGPSDDIAVRAERARSQRSLLSTLLLSQGIPMLLAGDDHGNSQRGNNNAYCQDNPIGWLDWNEDKEAQALHSFVCDLVALRRSEPALQRHWHQHGELIGTHTGLAEVSWFGVNGQPMQSDQWRDARLAFVALQLIGDVEIDAEIGLIDPDQHQAATLLLLFNAQSDAVNFPLLGGRGDSPGSRMQATGPWRRCVDSARGVVWPQTGHDKDLAPLEAGPLVEVPARSVIMLRCYTA